MNLLELHRCIISQESKKRTPIWIKEETQLEDGYCSISNKTLAVLLRKNVIQV